MADRGGEVYHRRNAWVRMGLVVLTVGFLTGCQGFALLDQPPEANFTVTPEAGSAALRVGEEVKLDASHSSDPQGYNLTYQWELKAPYDSLARLSSTSAKVVSFYPDSTAQYAISLKVTSRVQSGYSKTVLITPSIAASDRVLATIRTGEGGSVTPFGVRALSPSVALPIEAIPATGYAFRTWKVTQGSPLVADLSSPKTSLTITGVSSVVLEAVFAAVAVAPDFLVGLPFPYGLAEVDGTTGAVSTRGGSLPLVALARTSQGSLYGFGDDLVPRGAKLYALNATSGAPLSGTGVAIVDKDGAPITVVAGAFDAQGVLFAIEQGGTHRLFTVSPSTGVATVVGTPDAEIDSLAMSSSGILYGIGAMTLYKLNPVTAAATTVGALDSPQRLVSMTFSSAGNLYAVDQQNPATIYSIDPATAATTKLVTLAKGSLLSLICGL